MKSDASDFKLKKEKLGKIQVSLMDARIKSGHDVAGVMPAFAGIHDLPSAAALYAEVVDTRAKARA